MLGDGRVNGVQFFDGDDFWHSAPFKWRDSKYRAT